MTQDEIQEAARFAYCRGGTSESLFHIMWNSQPSASIGWSRDELIAFANAVAAKEREACAKLCEEPWQGSPRGIAEQIRARGDKA